MVFGLKSGMDEAAEVSSVRICFAWKDLIQNVAPRGRQVRAYSMKNTTVDNPCLIGVARCGRGRLGAAGARREWYKTQ